MRVSPVRRFAVPRAQSGMTMIELIVAMAVLFLLAAVSIPFYRDYMMTARKERIVETVRTFTMFEKNYYLDNQTYAAGEYKPGGVANTFPASMGFRMSNDQDQVSFLVEAGSCGDIADCYRVIATDVGGGLTGTYEAATGTWTWNPP